jgi:DNA polymerase I-like protein with 3'-5' exonuclease and polymerase domains
MITEADITRWKYNCKDIIYTYEIAEVLQKEYKSQPVKLQEFHNFQQNELAPALVDIMNSGIRIDLQKKEELHEQLGKLAVEVEEKINYLLEEPFNTRSVTQVKAVFQDLLKVKAKLNKKSGNATFGTEAMWAYLEEYPTYRTLIKLILELRSINVFLRTFLSAKVDEDGRMRTSYNVAGTSTYRLASRKNAFGNGMNLQNVPSKGKIDLKYAFMSIEGAEDTELDIDTAVSSSGITELPNCKTLFIPDEDYTFFDIDYSGADARVVAWDSDCKFLMDIFNDDSLDLYSVLASEYYKRKITKKDKERQTFKAVCHATNYLGKAPTIAGRAGLLIAEVDMVQKWYFSACPEVKKWQDRITKDVDKLGYISNVFGARGWFLDKTDKNLYNKAVAWVPQSTIGILVNKGLVNIARKEKKEDVQVLMQTHDSLSGQFRTSDLEAAQRITNHMSIELQYKKPLIIPAGIKTSTKSYGDC